MAGYDDGKSMHDDDMIDHAETITTSCDEIVTALAKAQVLDTIIAMVKGARPLNFDEEFARSLSQTRESERYWNLNQQQAGHPPIVRT